MEKAIIFEPALLAEIERESPDLYEFYRDCPLSKLEFFDYGKEGQHCYCRKDIINGLNLLFEVEPSSFDKIIKSFEAGYNYGRMDLKKKLPDEPFEFIDDREVLQEVFDLILNYPFYELESLLDENNFGKRDGLLYNKITYREAQYYTAWEIVLRHHKDFNDVFEGINAMQKEHPQQNNT